MKKILLILTALGVVTACSTTEQPENREIGIANPASEYCIKKGGESIVKADENGGQYGICRFKDGSEVDEWEYYRNSKAGSKSGELQIKAGIGIK